MKKKKAMLFPYDTSLLHMVIHRDTINEYEIVKVVSLKSWGVLWSRCRSKAWCKYRRYGNR